MVDLYVNDYRPWPNWVDQGNREFATRFNAQIGTYRGHADRDPGHDMTGDLAADFWFYDNTKARHDAALNWFIRDNFANARRLGMTYIITWRRIASVARASEGVRDYNGSDPHTSHPHISYGTTPPAQQPPQEDDDLPTVHEVWNGQQEVDNVWHPKSDGSPGGRCLPATALEEIGRDGNRIQAELVAHRNQLAALDAKLDTILAALNP